MLTGRRTFEVADGGGGQHPWDVPTFVATRQVPDGWPPPTRTVAAPPNEGYRTATSGSTRSGARSRGGVAGRTPSAHRELSIDATCIHHLIVKGSGWTSGSKTRPA
jgi:hypothetical protein